MNGPPPDAQAAKAKQLVGWSRLGALLGVLVMAGGCGIGIATRTPILMAIGAALGFVGLLVAAIIGQIGRAMQGRVI